MCLLPKTAQDSKNSMTTLVQVAICKKVTVHTALANNGKMQSKYYIISVLINGLRGMPSFHSMMNDAQIAAVTQYMHSDLNNFTDTVTTANVAQLRHDFPPGSDPSE